MEMLVAVVVTPACCNGVLVVQYQPNQILKKYNEEIEGVKKVSIVLGK